jgi:hypothetical protein
MISAERRKVLLLEEKATTPTSLLLPLTHRSSIMITKKKTEARVQCN